MKSGEETLPSSPIGQDAWTWTWRALPRADRFRISGWMTWTILVTVVFIQPLTRLMFHAAQSELHSYIPLVPFVAGYLLYIRRKALSVRYRTSIGGTLIMSSIGFAAVAGGFRL